MRDTMAGQPAALRALLADPDPARRAAERLAGRRVILVGTGTSWHAANHGALLMRAAGVEAWPLQAADAASAPGVLSRRDGVLLLSHTGAKRYGSLVREWCLTGGVTCVTVGARGTGADVETVERERSSAYTASHLGALMRLAQIAVALGADLGPLDEVPGAVADRLDGTGPGVAPPERLLELIGSGPNQWTAAEGALKVRETARVAAEGLSAEQLLHGPSVALGERDTLVSLDGGGPQAERQEAIAAAAQATGTTVVRIAARELGEALSIFALTAAVQRIALECAGSRGADPDAFGYDVPGREEAWKPVGF